MHAWFFEEWWGDFLNLFGIKNAIGLPAYAVMMFLAFLAGVLVVLLVYKKFGFSFGDVIWMAVHAAVFGLFGAHFFSWLMRIGEVDFSSFDTFWESSLNLFSKLMYYGGFMGGVIGMAIFSWKQNKPLYKTFDMAALVLPLCHAIGRVGCFLAGCCYGRQTESSIGVDFIYGHSVGKVIPTQLFEVGFNLILFAALVILFVAVYKRGDCMEKCGLLAGVYMVCYAVFRFIIEFFRDDARGEVLFMSTSQFISVFVLAFGVYCLVRYFKSRKSVEKCQTEPQNVELEITE